MKLKMNLNMNLINTHLNIKKLQRFYLYSYRFVGFVFLVSLISSILWYGFSVLFFIANSSWSIPSILSPNQENVLAHQEHILDVQHELLKNTAELAAARDALKSKTAILKNSKEVYTRVVASMAQQSRRYAKSSRVFHSLTEEKDKSVLELSKVATEIKGKEDIINKELKIGLITKEEALTQHLMLSTLRSSLVEAKARAYELKQHALNDRTAARTLDGSSINLPAMNKVVKKVELMQHISGLKSDVYSLTIMVNHLDSIIKKRAKVLHLMRKSPYILATKKPTDVAFVPYSNLNHVKLGSKVYSCYLDMLLCYESGAVTQIYKAEEYSRHPIFKSEIKGKYIGITFKNELDARKKLLFLNSKPLLF
jgi:hypothetical protein